MILNKRDGIVIVIKVDLGFRFLVIREFNFFRSVVDRNGSDVSMIAVGIKLFRRNVDVIVVEIYPGCSLDSNANNIVLALDITG